jgi:alpha-L-arabinofuranosidase
LVNAIAPIMTSEQGCWAQTIYWPFMHASLYGRGTALRPIVNAPLYSSKDFDDVPLLDATAVQGDDGSLTVFAVNRSSDSDILLTCDLRAFDHLKFDEHIVMHHDDVKAANTESAPNTVIPVSKPGCDPENGLFTLKVPALSWNVLKFSAS